MENLYCIECPVGCELKVAGTGAYMSIEGNKCSKGKEFAKAETSNPMRVLTTTVRTNFPNIPVISVRTDGEIPRKMLMKAMQELRNVTVEEELNCGDVVVENLLDTGVSVIITSGALQQVGAELENRNAQLSGDITGGTAKPVVTAMPNATTTTDDEQVEDEDIDEDEEFRRNRSHIRR